LEPQEDPAETLHNLLVNAPFPSLFLDEQLRLRRYTANAAGLWGVSLTDRGRSLGDLGLTADDPELLADAERVRAEGGPREREITIRNAQCYLRVVQPFQNAQDERAGVVVTWVDITARKTAEQDLAEALARLQFHVDNSPLGVFEWDAERRIVHWSNSAERLSGWPASAVEGRRLEDFHSVHPDDEPSIRHMMNALLQGEVQRNVSRHRHYRTDGSLIHCACYNSVRRDAQGNLLTVLTLMLDITEQQALEDRLRQSARALERADQRKNEFLATLAHELRNPLAPLNNVLYTLSETPGGRSEIGDWALGLMRRQLDQLNHLVDDLLDVARITTGTLELERSPVDLHQLVDDALETADPLLSQGEHHIEVELPAESVPVDVDHHRIAQVIGNLLRNAATYTPPKGRIRVSAEPQDRWVTVRVADNGRGMAPEEIPQIFDLYSHGPRLNRGDDEGLGLGLTIVRQLVEMHGGLIWAESPGPGQGSAFYFTLPRAAQASPSGDHRGVAAATPAEPAVAAPGGTEPVSILVVDDNADVADSFVVMLRTLGYTAEPVLSGQAALDHVHDALTRVLLVDLGMPDIDGLEVARRLQEHPRRPEMLLIAITGYGQYRDVSDALEAGFDHHLIKPVDVVVLSDLIERWSQKRATRGG
jgi:PAS domain S-box-containing protein